MPLYWLLRQLSKVALRWYYADPVVQGRDRVPGTGPVLLVANHPNALVDAMVVATTVRRRVLLTAKATLFEHAGLAALLRGVGVVPLRRVQDERAARSGTGQGGSVARNAGTFQRVTDALARSGAVLVFPEGISHDAPELAPLKTGAARMALGAASAGVRGLHVVPVGLIYEAKERVRSRVLVRIGSPIDLDRWRASTHPADAAALTALIDRALREVTLNFASDQRASRTLDLARSLAAITGEVPTLSQPRDLAQEADLARRIEAAADALSRAPERVARQADVFIARVDRLDARLIERGATLADLRISPLLRHGGRFLLREVGLVLVALPAAIVGRVTHWIPIRLARSAAMRPLSDDPSRDQPAMRTIVIGTGALLLWYTMLGIVLAVRFGARIAVLSLVGALVAARVDVLLRDRLTRARRRARTYLALRRDPRLREDGLAEAADLLDEAVALEGALTAAGRGP